MAGPKDILRSIDNTGRDAFRAAGRWTGRALGNMIAPVIGGAAAGAIGDAIGRIAYRTMQIFAAALAANFILTIIAAAILVVFSAFALFIINSGAYIVPPGSLSGQLPPAGNWPTIDVGASCPIPNGQILTGSYGSPNGTTQHGTNEYWDSLGRQCTAWPLPYVGGCYARQSGDYCFATQNSCTYYGFAADFIYPEIQAGGQPVHLPYIEGQSVTWNVDWAQINPDSNQGRGVLNTVYNGTSYEIYVTHLENEPVGGVSGQVFGTLYPATTFTPHLHIELRIDGEFVPPDFMCTGGSPGTGGVLATEGCFQFTGPWPEEELANEVEAASIVMSNTGYSDALCRGGMINVAYTTPGECEDGLCYGGRARGQQREILIFPPGTGSVANSLFTLAHESGHILQISSSADSGMFENAGVIAELPPYYPTGSGTNYWMTGLCTYPLDGQPASGLQVPFTENFAEAIALFIAGSNPESSYRDMSCLGGTFRTRYPNTWSYIRNSVFFDNGPW